MRKSGKQMSPSSLTSPGFVATQNFSIFIAYFLLFRPKFRPRCTISPLINAASGRTGYSEFEGKSIAKKRGFVKGAQQALNNCVPCIIMFIENEQG